VNARSPFPDSLLRTARQCRRFPEPEAPSAVEVQDDHPRGHPLWSPAPVGRRAQALHVLIAVREPRLDLLRTALAGVSWPRALPRLLQIDVSTSTTMDRSSIPGRGRPWPGRPPFLDRSLPFDRRRPLKVLRVRGRGSPSLDLPSRDCSRKRLCPDPDCFRHLVSRALPVALSGVDEGDRRSRLRRGR